MPRVKAKEAYKTNILSFDSPSLFSSSYTSSLTPSPFLSVFTASVLNQPSPAPFLVDEFAFALLLPVCGFSLRAFMALRDEEDGKHPHKQQRHARFLPIASLCHETL